jgi:hypothetical protein
LIRLRCTRPLGLSSRHSVEHFPLAFQMVKGGLALLPALPRQPSPKLEVLANRSKVPSLADARRHKFDAVLVWAFDRMARSVRHFLEILDELNHLGIEFVSFRENIDTGGPLGRAMVVIVGAIAELEKNLIVERVRAGMRRARLEGRQIRRSPLKIDRARLVDDRRSGMSLSQVAKKHRVSRATVWNGSHQLILILVS